MTEKNTIPDIKPCPDCRCNQCNLIRNSYKEFYHVNCPSCGLYGLRYYDAKKAVETWNDIPESDFAASKLNPNRHMSGTGNQYRK